MWKEFPDMLQVTATRFATSPSVPLGISPESQGIRGGRTRTRCLLLFRDAGDMWHLLRDQGIEGPGSAAEGSCW